MANFCVRYGNRVFVMANSKIVVFFMVKNRCVRYGCVRYDGTPQLSLISKKGCDNIFQDLEPPILLKKSPLDLEITRC